MNYEEDKDKIIEEFKNSLAENKNEMIKSYSELVAKYEEGGNLTASKTIIDCAFVGIQELAGVIVKFSLITVDTGLKVYQSPKYKLWDYCMIDFEALNFVPGTEFYLKAEVEAGDDSTCSQILRYAPHTIWALYDLKGTTFNTWFVNHQ